MTPQRWQQVKTLLDNALTLDVAARASYLAAMCAGDAELRDEVESLLASNAPIGHHVLDAPLFQEHDAAAPSVPRAPVGRRIGPYQLLEQIGHGGMGEVYRAQRVDGQYAQQVAIKLIRSGYEEARDVLDRFWTERQILAGLNHPNIARLLDGGTTEDGSPYLAMELVEGTRIHVYADAHRLNITSRLKLFQQVCSAVQYAHQHLVVHRDIKPTNILVTQSGVPKLLDFGIAKILVPSRAIEATRLGPMTLQYASPEQISGEPITTASDVYSLGVVLYQLLSGHSPYRVDAATPRALERAIAETEALRPSVVVAQTETACEEGAEQELTPASVSATREGSPPKLKRRLSGDLDHIVLKALRKEARERYASVEQLADDIQRHLDGHPVAARKGTWSYHAQKFGRRHKVGMAATALFSVAITAGVAATLHEARVAAANARHADKRFDDVRKLANSLLFEIHDAIENIPGTTAARQLIVQRSLEYLDSLAREAGGDFSLQRELATAYQKVGQVQGDTAAPNLGDLAGALASYRKALAARRVIARAYPGSVEDRVALGGSLRSLCSLQLLGFGDVEGAFESCRQSVATVAEAVKASPKNEAALEELLLDYRQLGIVQSGGGTTGSMDDPAAALESGRQALALSEQLAHAAPSNANRQRLLALVDTSVGENLVKIGERAQALSYYERARAIHEGLASDPSNVKAHLSFALIHRYIADVYLLDRKFAEARPLYDKEVQLAERSSAADPKDLLARMSAAGAHGNLGICLVDMNHLREGLEHLNLAVSQMDAFLRTSNVSELRTNIALITIWIGEGHQRGGDLEKARRSFSRAFDMYAAILTANPKDAGTRVNLAQARGRIGGAFLKAGDADNALAEYRQALTAAESLAAAGTSSMAALYTLADTYAGLGDVSAFRAAKTTGGAERSKHSSEAQHWYAKSLHTWESIPNPSHISPKGFLVTDPREVEHRARLVADATAARQE